jgi:hypothetical protein
MDTDRRYNICLHTHKYLLEIQLAYDGGMEGLDRLFDALLGHEVGDRLHRDHSCDVVDTINDILADADVTCAVAAFALRKLLHEYQPDTYAEPDQNNMPEPEPENIPQIVFVLRSLELSLRNIHN